VKREQGAKPADRANDRRKSYGDSTSEPSDTLFCGNLSFDADQDTISQAFGEYGTVLGVRLPTDRETGAPKGFGYVTFSSVEEAGAAMESMNGAEIAGRSVRLDYSQPRPQNGDSPARGRGGFGGGRGGGRGFGDRGGRGGGRGFGGGRGGGRGFGDRGGRGGGRGASTNRGGFGDFSGKKTTF
jgi:nucleolin